MRQEEFAQVISARRLTLVYDDGIRMLDRRSNAPEFQLEGPPKDSQLAGFSRDGRWLIGGGGPSGVSVWNVAERSRRMLLPCGEADRLAFTDQSDELMVARLARNPASKRMVAAEVWDLASLSLKETLPTQDALQGTAALTVSDCGNVLAIGDWGGSVQTWSYPKRKLLSEFTVFNDGSMSILSFAAADSRLIASRMRFGFTFLPQWPYFASAKEHPYGEIQAFDVSTGKRAQSWVLESGMFLVKPVPNSNDFITADPTGKITLCRVR